MIKHIVMWRLGENDRENNLLKMKEILEDLKDKISEIVEIEAGIDINGSEAAYDIALYSSFENEEDLTTYQKHPDHLKAAEFIKKVTIDRAVVDYEV